MSKLTKMLMLGLLFSLSASYGYAQVLPDINFRGLSCQPDPFFNPGASVTVLDPTPLVPVTYMPTAGQSDCRPTRQEAEIEAKRGAKKLCSCIAKGARSLQWELDRLHKRDPFVCLTLPCNEGGFTSSCRAGCWLRDSRYDPRPILECYLSWAEQLLSSPDLLSLNGAIDAMCH